MGNHRTKSRMILKKCVTLQDEIYKQAVMADRAILVADQSDYEALKTFGDGVCDMLSLYCFSMFQSAFP